MREHEAESRTPVVANAAWRPVKVVQHPAFRGHEQDGRGTRARVELRVVRLSGMNHPATRPAPRVAPAAQEAQPLQAF